MQTLHRIYRTKSLAMAREKERESEWTVGSSQIKSFIEKFSLEKINKMALRFSYRVWRIQAIRWGPFEAFHSHN